MSCLRRLRRSGCPFVGLVRPRVATRGGFSRRRRPRLSTFLVYSTWAAFQGDHYTSGPYLSPFYSPEVFGTSTHSWFGPPPASWPRGCRFPRRCSSCRSRVCSDDLYYYRGAYYKAFWADPPSCTVGEPRSSYLGESSFPLVLQNFHRYALFLSLAVLFILYADVWKALWFTNPSTGTVSFGVGVGTLVLATNCVLFSAYLFGCHSLRHVVGGCVDQVSRAPLGLRAYSCVSCLNRKHMVWAWCSLFTVGFSDLYVRLCSMGVWPDFRIL